MKTINLLPSSENKEVKLQLMSIQLTNFWFYIVSGLIMFGLLALIVTILLRNQISQTTNNIADKQTELASSNTQQLESRVQGLNSQIRSIKNLTNNHYEWSRALIEISRVTPEKVKLNLLDVNTVTGKVDLSGTAEDREAVIEFWSNVKKSKYFKDINFPFSNLERETDASFSYTFYLNRDLFKYESSN